MELLRLAILFCVSTAIDCERSAVVNSKNGRLQGTVVSSDSGFEVEQFLGIPYGKVPERFSKSVPVEPWDGVKIANKLPTICIQTESFIYDDQPSKLEDSEDCLFLNLFAPHEKISGGYPVMVFIHGGGFQIGSSMEYGTEGIAEWIVPKGVVFINFHYRLGLWGFFSTGTDEAKGNWGLWDQSLLLKWVQDNVQQFGGNPNKVTVFGESAGSMSVSMQTLSPHSRDLFHNAILMSGSSLTQQFVSDTTIDVSLTVAKSVNCQDSDKRELLNCMRSKSNSELLEAVKKTNLEFGFVPRIDDDFFPQDTVENLIKRSVQKPIIIGVTNEEMGLFVTPPNPSLKTAFTIKDPKSFTIEQLRNIVMGTFSRSGFSNAELLTELALYHYVDSHGSRDNGTFLTRAFSDFLGDQTFVVPSAREARLRREAGSKVWLYEFDYFNPKFTPGAYHFYDLWYFFKMVVHRTNEYSSEELQVADHYTTLLTNFAKFGDPTETAVDGIQWPRIDDEFPELYLAIDKALEVKNHFKRSSLAFWLELLPLMANKKTDHFNSDSTDSQSKKKEEL